MPRFRKPASPLRYVKASPGVIRLVVRMYVRFALFAGDIRRAAPVSLVGLPSLVPAPGRNVRDAEWRTGLSLASGGSRGKRHGDPEAIATDGLRSYGAALNEIGDREKQAVGRRANEPVENRHLTFRRERAMPRFRQMTMLRG